MIHSTFTKLVAVVGTHCLYISIILPVSLLGRLYFFLNSPATECSVFSSPCLKRLPVEDTRLEREEVCVGGDEGGDIRYVCVGV